MCVGVCTAVRTFVREHTNLPIIRNKTRLHSLSCARTCTRVTGDLGMDIVHAEQRTYCTFSCKPTVTLQHGWPSTLTLQEPSQTKRTWPWASTLFGAYQPLLPVSPRSRQQGRYHQQTRFGVHPFVRPSEARPPTEFPSRRKVGCRLACAWSVGMRK